METWQTGPAPDMAPGNVHIWWVDLNLPDVFVQQLWLILSDDERKRAQRFYFERDRRRFVAARGTLRLVLGHYLRHPPDTIQFCYEPAGKPYLSPSGSESTINFNVSHSGEAALIGLCQDERVGIDIEFKNRDHATLAVARHFFAPEEIAALENLPADARCDAFYRIWAMKESYIKGRGEGVSLGLDTFAVSLACEQPSALLRSSEGESELKRWRFWAVDVGENYAASLAVEGAGERRLSFWRAAFHEADQNA